MKTVTRSLLLSYSPISSDQLVELYCRALITVHKINALRIFAFITFVCTYMVNESQLATSSHDYILFKVQLMNSNYVINSVTPY